MNAGASPTGSGNTTLMHALMGESKLTSGKLSMPREPVLLVPQTAWLLNATICENIVFNTPFDEERNNRVVYWAH